MISRTHRFHGYNSLRHTYNHGFVLRDQLLSLRYVANPRRTSYRAAVVVSRKVHKSAVVRGRIRRRIYEIIRGQEANIAGPYDIIITVFSEQVATLPAAQLQVQMVALLGQAQLAAPAASRSVTKPSGQTHDIVDTKE